MQAKDIKGKNIAMTGKFSEVKRAEAEAALARLGATIGSGITRTTDVLFAGDRAGSKLAKAKSLGVAILDEAALVALLKQAPIADAATGPRKKLAQKQEQDVAAATEMTKVVAELRAFVQALKKRKDITVEHATLGRKAGKDKLSFLETVGVPDELLEFHALMDGIRVEWRSIEFSGEGGCIRMSPVTQHSRFTGDEVHYMGFGDDREAMLLDEITPEGNTWLVRAKANKRKQRGDCTIIFAAAAEGADGIVVANSISAYLRDAMRHSFAFYWPRATPDE